MQEPDQRKRQELGARHHLAGLVHGGAGLAGGDHSAWVRSGPSFYASIEMLQWTVNA